MLDKVEKNRYDYYELIHKPSEDELQQYYAMKYYQEDNSSYSQTYSSEEIQYIRNKIEQKYTVIQKILHPSVQLSLLDVGCGEGWALEFFNKKGWDVQGLDYSNHGCMTHNPQMSPNLQVGDIYRNLDRMINNNQVFNVIWLDNVLEHVLDPGGLLEKCNQLITDGGVLLIEVPNDFSLVQQHLLQTNQIERPFWIAIPDHISYFNRNGLIALCEDYSWTNYLTMSDYPIDLHLFNEHTNYITDRSKGPSCHKSRVAIENLMHSSSIEKTNEMYRIMSELGIGRQIIGFFQRSRKT
ncbi:MAG: class SAM-dependent methyltransferase [Paenibacillus sp.]|nr:class SAM-dependent methyltransferase [Paenibacillus sp.]